MKILRIIILFSPLRSCADAFESRQLQNGCLLTAATKLLGNQIANFSGDSVALSADGSEVALGFPGRVFSYSHKEWVQRLGVFENVTGEAVALSADGYTVAANWNVNNRTQVLKYSKTSNSWTQLGGDISDNAILLKLSADGNILAVGTSDASASYPIRVFQWNGTVWNQMGNDIPNGVLDSETMAISANGTLLAYTTRVPTLRIVQYEEGKGWRQIGQDIDRGSIFAHSIAISTDGFTVAAGAAVYGTPVMGEVHVFRYSLNETWTQVADVIKGETSLDNAGSSVALARNGTVLVVGANGYTGRVRLYTYAEDQPMWIQMGETIEGVEIDERFGSSIALTSDGNTMAVNAIHPSAVRVYSISYTCAPTEMPSKPSDVNSGISSGGIAGIADGAALVIAIAVFVGWKVVATKQQRSASNSAPQQSLAEQRQGPVSDASATASLQPLTNTSPQASEISLNNSGPGINDELRLADQPLPVAKALPMSTEAPTDGDNWPSYKDHLRARFPLVDAVAVEY